MLLLLGRIYIRFFIFFAFVGISNVDLNGSKADRELASIPNDRVVTSWDDMIPLSCQRASDRPHRPHFRHPPGIICKTGVLGKPTAGQTTCE